MYCIDSETVRIGLWITTKLNPIFMNSTVLPPIHDPFDTLCFTNKSTHMTLPDDIRSMNCYEDYTEIWNNLRDNYDTYNHEYEQQFLKRYAHYTPSSAELKMAYDDYEHAVLQIREIETTLDYPRGKDYNQWVIACGINHQQYKDLKAKRRALKKVKQVNETIIKHIEGVRLMYRFYCYIFKVDYNTTNIARDVENEINDKREMYFIPHDEYDEEEDMFDIEEFLAISDDSTDDEINMPDQLNESNVSNVSNELNATDESNQPYQPIEPIETDENTESTESNELPNTQHNFANYAESSVIPSILQTLDSNGNFVDVEFSDFDSNDLNQSIDEDEITNQTFQNDLLNINYDEIYGENTIDSEMYCNAYRMDSEDFDYYDDDEINNNDY